jgi:uncharacterized protein (TIGR04551 family)
VNPPFAAIATRIGRCKVSAAAALGAALFFSAGAAKATGFTDIGEDIRSKTETTFKVTGNLRVRGEILHNLDLDRGPTPSGQLFYPVPLSDPKGQTLAAADFRLRTDLAFYSPGYGVAVKARFDAPDNLLLGGAADGFPAAASSQRPVTALSLKRAYGEALTPIGIFSAGRMGSHWGLGMLANGGDCADCDSGDSADRLAFLTPIAGHIWAMAFDISATGPFRRRKIETRAVDIDPNDDVRTFTFAVLRYRDDLARERRRKADKGTFEYGAYVSHRWQKNDVPADYLPVAQPVLVDARQSMARGYTATAFDFWARLTLPSVRVELEAAALIATIDQPSLIPGLLLRQPAASRQFGVAMESEIGRPEDRFTWGLDAGFASGDPAPGFGVKQSVNASASKPGDLDGPQANPPSDNRVDNFRFHPDYRVDRILFREIIGTVTDAVYLRPHVRFAIARLGPSTLSASLHGVASFAVNATSAPGQKSPLGIELDPTLAYGSRDGFSFALDHAVLFPLQGLDNVEKNLAAKPAQLIRLRAIYGF